MVQEKRPPPPSPSVRLVVVVYYAGFRIKLCYFEEQMLCLEEMERTGASFELQKTKKKKMLVEKVNLAISSFEGRKI